jgi:translation initiation factor 5
MATVNIPRDIKGDIYYRYKMPALIATVLQMCLIYFLSYYHLLFIFNLCAKVEGRGNGIKTLIANMSDIAKSLARPPTFPLKFFGYEVRQ